MGDLDVETFLLIVSVVLERAEDELELILFVLQFYGPVNPLGSCQARSVYLTTR